jgi:UDP-GlcNAc:undecaprenyl-phosphate GlcNAc-1-phosphate transferase
MPLPIEIIYFAIALQAFLFSLLLVPVANRIGHRYGFMDPVNPAKIHSEPKARCGGIAVFFAFVLTLGLDLLIFHAIRGTSLLPPLLTPFAPNIRFVSGKLVAVLAGATLLFFTGLLDDRKNLKPLTKLVLQIISALPLIAVGATARAFINSDFLNAMLTICWVVLLTNAFNFMDNMDGLSAGVACVCSFSFFLISRFGGEYFMMAIFAILFGSIAGFLIFNFPAARLFMGDSGSLFIGYMLAALSTLVTYYHKGVPTQLPVVAPIIVLGVPIFDTVSVLFIRWRSGKPLMKGDQNHFSHRLVALGFSRRDAVLFIYVVTLTVGLSAISLRFLDWEGALFALAQTVLFFLLIYQLERTARKQTMKGSS